MSVVRALCNSPTRDSQQALGLFLPSRNMGLGMPQDVTRVVLGLAFLMLQRLLLTVPS